METKPKAKQLIDFAREVRALLGDDEHVSITCTPNGAAIFSRKRDIALFGPNKGGWRSKNEKIIANLRLELAALAKEKATVETPAAVTA